MKKHLALGIAITFAGSLLVTPAFGAAKVGTTCSKAGLTSIISDKKYTCIKTGNRLIWSSGVVTPKIPTNVKSNTNTAQSASPTPTPSDSPTPTPISLPTSFQDLNQNFQGITKAAWTFASNQIASASPTPGTINLLIGPNTIPMNSNPLTAISKTAALYSDGSIPKVTHLIEFSIEDIDWAQPKYIALQDQTWRQDFSTFIKSHCPDVTCNNGNTQVNNKGEIIITLGEYSGLSKDEKEIYQLNRFDGELEAHEFTHGIQITTAKNFRWAMMPVWLLEGMATWSEGPVAANNYEEYLKLRGFRIGQLYQNPSLYNSDWITTFLNPNPNLQFNQDNRVYWSSYERFRPYDVGSLVVEVLVALKGPNQVIKMFSDVDSGLGFTEAFQKEYGMPWAEACPLISSAIAKELALGQLKK